MDDKVCEKCVICVIVWQKVICTQELNCEVKDFTCESAVCADGSLDCHQGSTALRLRLLNHHDNCKSIFNTSFIIDGSQDKWKTNNLPVIFSRRGKVKLQSRYFSLLLLLSVPLPPCPLSRFPQHSTAESLTLTNFASFVPKVSDIVTS